MMRPLQSLLGVSLITSCFGALARRTSEHEKKPEEWYTRYNSYPPYCSTPDAMRQRSIPLLDSSIKYGHNSQLVHVTAIIRHGARTPYSGNMQCWEHYHDNADTGSWNCDLTTWLAPPSPQRVEQEEDEPVDTSAQSEAMFIFEKNYDALLVSPKDGNNVNDNRHLTNLLNGTCQVGQLLLQGYEQQITNGKQFRQAYVYDSSAASSSSSISSNDTTSDPRMQLIDVASASVRSQPWNRSQLRFRTDDDQRTIMSGQVLLRGMFEREIGAYFTTQGEYPVIPVHTADRVQDILGANARVCPRLDQLLQRYQESDAHQAFMELEESQTIMNFHRDVLKLPEGQRMNAIDCLMTTMCTDRTLPDPVDDYNPAFDNVTFAGSHHARALNDYGNNIFNRLYNWDVQRYVLQQTYNDADYAKLAMSFLWAEIVDGMDKVVRKEDDAVKLSLISAHDTTIMGLLMTLGSRVFDGTWAPYASKLLIEIHQMPIDRDASVFVSEFAFRLHYNGHVLTHLLDGCSDDLQLCDVQVLLDVVKPFASRSLDCQVDIVVDTSSIKTSDLSQANVSVTVIVMLLMGVVSALLGSMVTYIYLSRAVPRGHHTRRRQGEAHEADKIHDDSLRLQEYTNGHIQESEGTFA